MPETIRQSDAARMLGISPQAVARYIEDGRLSTVEVDGRRMLVLDEVKSLNPRLGWSRIRVAFEEEVKNAIAALKEEKAFFDAGQVMGKVVETMYNSGTIEARLHRTLRDNTHQGQRNDLLRSAT